MRLLSRGEQNLCLGILAGKDSDYNVIPNIIDDQLSEVRIEIIREPKSVEILYPDFQQGTITTKEYYDKIIFRLQEVSVLIVTITNLVTLLEREGYILTYQKAPLNPNIGAGQGVSDHYKNVTSDLHDKSIIELCIKYWERAIIVTPEFERFCKSGFITRDEQRHKEQMKIAHITTIIAILAFAVSCFTPFLDKSSKNSTSINQDQVSTITNAINKTQVSIDTLCGTAKKIQTTINYRPSKNKK